MLVKREKLSLVILRIRVILSFSEGSRCPDTGEMKEAESSDVLAEQ